METDTNKSPQRETDLSLSAAIGDSKEHKGLVKSGESVLSRSDADVSQSDADVSQSDADVSQSDANISQSNADVSQSDSNISLSDADVSLSDANVSLSDANVSLSDANVSHSDANVSQSDANVSQSDANVLQSDANVSQSEAAKLALLAANSEPALPQVTGVNEDDPGDQNRNVRSELSVNAGPVQGPADLQSKGGAEATQGGAQGPSHGKNKNIVRLCWAGDEAHPLDRGRVSRLLFDSMGFRSDDIFAVAEVPRSRFDVCFQSAESLPKFWSLYKRKRTTDMWRSVQARPVSSSQVKAVTIAFKHEMIRRKDVLSWLQQHCTVLSPVRRVRDEDGIWNGEWRAQVKLNVVDNVLQHLPITFFIWNERGVVSYFGQPRLCYVCASTEHFASDCPIEKQRMIDEYNRSRMEDYDDYEAQYYGYGTETASCRQAGGIRL
eukprot:XP_002943397.1 PREDICTED: uncharacterized protein LOC100488592 isoform X1 [Xenopus tropicalis]